MPQQPPLYFRFSGDAPLHNSIWSQLLQGVTRATAAPLDEGVRVCATEKGAPVHSRTCSFISSHVISVQVRKPDGTPPDMERKADILVYEVRTCDCTSETQVLQYRGGLFARRTCSSCTEAFFGCFDDTVRGPENRCCHLPHIPSWNTVSHVPFRNSPCDACLQIHDSKLNGEGALHSVSAANEKLLAPDSAAICTYCFLNLSNFQWLR